MASALTVHVTCPGRRVLQGLLGCDGVGVAATGAPQRLPNVSMFLQPTVDDYPCITMQPCERVQLVFQRGYLDAGILTNPAVQSPRCSQPLATQ